MSLHIFGNRLKCLLRDKENVFWTMLFPILLAVFFNLALSNVNAGESFRYCLPLSTTAVSTTTRRCRQH